MQAGGDSGGDDDSFQDENQVAVQERADVDIFTIVKFVIVLCALAFMCLVIYMLLYGNIKAIQQACDGMWELILVRVIMSILVGIMILVIDMWYSNHDIVNGHYGYFFFLIYFLSFSVAEIAVIPKAMISNAMCTDTLSNNSPTGTPLLGVLGWIMLGMDWCFVAVMSFAFCMERCRLGMR